MGQLIGSPPPIGGMTVNLVDLIAAIWRLSTPSQLIPYTAVLTVNLKLFYAIELSLNVCEL